MLPHAVESLFAPGTHVNVIFPSDDLLYRGHDLLCGLCKRVRGIAPVSPVPTLFQRGNHLIERALQHFAFIFSHFTNPP